MRYYPFLLVSPAYKYEIMHRTLCIITIAVLLPAWVFCQYSVCGIVTDAETGESLAGAHIIMENTFIAAVSSPSGQFKITGLKIGEYQFRISYMGYETFSSSVKLVKDTTLQILLEPSAIMGSEVIVTATRAPGNSPTTFTTITSKEIEEILRLCL